MNKQFSRVSERSANKTKRLNGPLLVSASLALALTLSACNQQDANKTAGQKLDSAIAKTEQVAEEARVKAEQSAAQAKEKTEKTFANAGVALKNATQNAEVSAKDVASKAGEKIDDMTITAAVSARLSKDPDLSALKINVDTKNGAVTLNGSAPTEAARERAGKIAETVNGVQSVENKLTVKVS